MLCIKPETRHLPGVATEYTRHCCAYYLISTQQRKKQLGYKEYKYQLKQANLFQVSIMTFFFQIIVQI